VKKEELNKSFINLVNIVIKNIIGTYTRGIIDVVL